MLARDVVRQTLEDLGLNKTYTTASGEPDYSDVIYDSMNDLVEQANLANPGDLVDLLMNNNAVPPYQYTVAEASPGHYVVYPLDYPEYTAPVGVEEVTHWPRVEELAEALIYCAHQELMASWSPIMRPGEHRGQCASQVFELQLGDLYAFRLISYHLSLPTEHLPPKMRDDGGHIH